MSGSSSDSSKPSTNRLAARVKWAGIAVSLIAFLVLLRGLPVTQALQAAVAWVEGMGPLAPVAFAGIYFLATILLLPAWPLSIAAGALFGLFMGSAVVIIGATAGAAGAFILSRYFARTTVERKLKDYPRFAAVDRAVGEGGWKIVLLLRLSPAFPFTLQNYLYGLTAIRFWPCVLATAVGIVPGVFMYVYFGVAGRAGIEAVGGDIQGGWAQTLLLGTGLIATVLVTIYITKLARAAIAQHTEFASNAEAPVEESRAPAVNPWWTAIGSTVLAVILVLLAGCVHFPPPFLTRMISSFDGVTIETHETASQEAPPMQENPP